MKKWSMLLLAGLLILSGCGKTSFETETKKKYSGSRYK